MISSTLAVLATSPDGAQGLAAQGLAAQGLAAAVCGFAAAQGLQGAAAALAAAHGLQGLPAACLAAAQGLQGLAAVFAAAHGLHGVAAVLEAAQGLHAVAAAFVAAHGLQAAVFAAAHGLQGDFAAAQGFAVVTKGFLAAHGLQAATVSVTVFCSLCARPAGANETTAAAMIALPAAIDKTCGSAVDVNNFPLEADITITPKSKCAPQHQLLIILIVSYLKAINNSLAITHMCWPHPLRQGRKVVSPAGVIQATF